MRPRASVALVEDHLILAEALHAALNLQGCDVVTIPVVPVRSLSGLLASIIDARARVVLLDLDLGPAGDAVPLIRPLHGAGHRVVILTANDNPLRWGAALAQGALTVLPKTAPLAVIVDAIERADRGLPIMNATERRHLIQLWHEHQPASDDRRRRLSQLTPREEDVLAALVRGRRVREIAEDAVVSEATVRTQVKSILAKLGVSSQLAAVAVARDVGWPSTRSTAPTGSGPRTVSTGQPR